MPESKLFKTKSGELIPGFSAAEVLAQRNAVVSQLGLEAGRLVEAASYSMAMVVRYALGLSAKGGAVCGLVSDSLSSWVVLATLRHLLNAGAQVHVIFVRPSGEAGSSLLNQELGPLDKLGAEFHSWNSAEDNQSLSALLSQCHNCLFGLFDFDQKLSSIDSLIETLNEQATPVHTIDCPFGIDPLNSNVAPSTLVASSTLSLGAPLAILNKARDFVGRHYVCDISIPNSVYSSPECQLAPMFSEQPVIQIFPVIENHE